MTEPLLAELYAVPQDSAERDLAYRYAPAIRFDVNEPFLPLAAGYTIFRSPGESPSFSRGKQITLREGEQMAIEYAIWWDWDIQHLYELEHVWVYVGIDGRVTRVEASWHGGEHEMGAGSSVAFWEGRPVVFSEPGKHAFAPDLEWFHRLRGFFKYSVTRQRAGGGVHRNQYIDQHVAYTPQNDRLAWSYLAKCAFDPAWDFSKIFTFSAEMLVPWAALLAWMPRRVNERLAWLRQTLSPSDYRFWRIGHRGASRYKPDNSLAGIRHAASLGADMVELDLQMTRDGKIAVIHDLHLKTNDGRVLVVQKSTLAELQSVDLGGGERVPELWDVLMTCREEGLGMYLEIKAGQVLPGLAQAMHDLKYHSGCILASFRPDWVLDAVTLMPNLPGSVLFSSQQMTVERAVSLARAAGATYVHPCWESHPFPPDLLSPAWMEGVRAAGLGVILWHEERPDIIAALKTRGVDGICSDAPELLI